MKQLHIVQSIATDFGGLGIAALRYAQSLALAGEDVSLYVIDRKKKELDVNESLGLITIAGGERSGFIGKSLALKRYIDKFEFEFIHIHGTWSPVLAIASYVSLIKNIPLVISPHGCLEPHALLHRGYKKRIAFALYQGWIYRKASMLVATAGQELNSIRALKIKTPVAIIPNGVDCPPSISRSQGEVRKILFLSRIHPIKGLLDLVTAWANVRKPGWKVVIAGPDEGGHIHEIRKKINSFDLDQDFEFTGLVTGNKKEVLFSEADLFILPTYSENFGIAVAEALARGVPVITTTGAPWADLQTWSCGWWVTPGPQGVSTALIDAMDLSREDLNDMGNRGMQLVHEKYSWTNIGISAVQAYKWIISNDNSVPEIIDISK